MKHTKMDTLTTVAEMLILAGLLTALGLVGSIALDRRGMHRRQRQADIKWHFRRAMEIGVQDAVRSAMDAHADYWYGQSEKGESDDGGDDKRDRVPE